MRLVILSDTHGMHRRVDVPAGDVLVHCGDCLANGRTSEFVDFCDWLQAQPHAHKVFTPGNHDAVCESRTDRCRKLAVERNLTFLVDEQIEVDGVMFYGTPWTPTFFNWYFMKDRGSQISEVWKKIPPATDVLITHGPPYGHGDLAPPFRSPAQRAVGCVDLLLRLREVRPKVHAFGHIHCGYGITLSEDDQLINTLFVNASICTESYRPTNKPQVVDI